MPTRIDKLTPEQAARMPEWRDRWIKIGLSCEPMQHGDRWETERAIRGLYKKTNKAEPKALIFVPSPLVLRLAGGISAGVIYAMRNAWPGEQAREGLSRLAVHSAVGSAVGSAVSAVHSAVGSAVDSAVGSAVHSAVHSAVGSAVGSAVHSAVHSAVGSAVDSAVGSAVRSAVSAVHSAVHSAVGSAVDSAVRSAVDSAVGSAVHSAVRSAVHSAVDSAVDSAVGSAVHSAVHSAVGSAVGSAVSAVHSAVGSAVDSAVRSAVDSAVDSAVGSAVHSAVHSAVDSAVHSAVGSAVSAVDSAVRSAVDSAVRSAVLEDRARYLLQCANYASSFEWGGPWWCGWASWVTFFRDVCELEIAAKHAERFADFEVTESRCGPYSLHDDFAMVSDRPIVLHRDAAGRLHCANGPAIAWRDGWSLYFWHGFVIPQAHHWIVQERERLTADAIDGERNAELRRVMLEIYGFDRYLAERDARVIAQDELHGQPRRLLELTVAGLPIRIIEVNNGSLEPDGTRRKFHVGALAGQTPDEVIAASYGISPKHYREAVRS